MKKIFIIGGVVIIALAIGGYFYFGREVAPEYEYTVAKQGDLVQEVSVTGKVKPAEAVDLAFEKSGKIKRSAVKVGDKIKSGQILAELDSADAQAQVNQAMASLESARAKLAELKKGAREEELRVAEVKVKNAETTLADARLNLENIRQKAEADLKEDYDSALALAVKSLSIATHSLFVITDIQNARFADYDQQSVGVADAKAAAVAALLGVYGSGRASNNYLSQLNGGAKLAVGNAQIYPANENIDGALSQLKDALKKLKSALDAIPVLSTFTATESANLNTEKTNIAGELSTISGKQQAIEVQKASNQNAIASAQASVNSAAGALESAKDELALKEAGSSAEAIAAQEAQVNEAGARLQASQAQLSKSVLQSPIDGVVIKQDAKTGEIVLANSPLISIISGAGFEMEANVPEADTAKVKIGDGARVTLDAYGNDVIFKAKVAKIDPAETVVEGVATYKTTLAFLEDDGRVKSGMTANIDIETARRDGVIFIPRRATVKKDNRVIVFVAGAGQPPAERVVKLGLVGSDGNVEVQEGLSEDEQIIVNPEKIAQSF